jgi:vacuolar-type H+-ATPase subunit C/Vma6
MSIRLTTGIDYLAAALHGRRSRMAEGERLAALAGARSIAELARALYGDTAAASAVALQRHLVVDRVNELLDLARQLDGPAGELFDWMAVRTQVENLKVLARGVAGRLALSEIEAHLVPLPGHLAMDVRPLASSATVETLAYLVPRGPLQAAVQEGLAVFRTHPRAFFIEAALDRGYFAELLARVEAIPGADREDVWAVASQEVDIFHLMLVVRGRFHYGLGADLLLPLHVSGSRIRATEMAAMLAAADLGAAAERAVGLVIGALPEASAADAVAIERMAWERYHSVAAAIFRRSHMGLGMAAAYVALRRVELANLITVSEGIRAGLSADDIRRRMVPRLEGGATRV